MTRNDGAPRTGRQELDAVRTETDCLAVTDDGELAVDGHGVRSLLAEFGSPLYILSEQTIRANFRRVTRAFGAHWPAPVLVLYAIKANNNVAVRRIISAEGGGGDCFGMGELRATVDGGADMTKVVLNGSNKSEAELRFAVEHEMVVNIDAVDEIDRLAAICAETGRRARANLRLKVAPDGLDAHTSDFHAIGRGGLVAAVLDEKWGFAHPYAADLVGRILATPGVDLLGYHVHMGRIGQDPQIQHLWASDLARVVLAIRAATGFAPRLLDIGGGWARQRDPESRAMAMNPHQIEEYAEVTCRALSDLFAPAGIELPALWLEPGRYLVGNAGVLVGTVGAVKRDVGRTWFNVDMSTNNLTRIDSADCAHVVLPADGMDRPYAVRAFVVGSTCTGSVLAHRPMPELVRGDLVAVLDAGMYAETTSNQYNGMPRPATVLVGDGSADLVKVRETVRDVFRLHRVPARLAGTVGVDGTGTGGPARPSGVRGRA